MMPLSYSSNSDWSKVFMPRRFDLPITSLIAATSPLKIRSAISGEFSMISMAAMRPVPASRGTRRCEISARMFSDRSISSCSRRSSGKKLMMRSSAWLALLACSVASTVAGFGELDAVLHRLAVTDFADQDHVGRLAQRVLQRRVPAVAYPRPLRAE